MKIAVLLSILILSSFVNAYAEPIVMEQVTPNGMVKVQLTWPEVLPNELYNASLRFLDPDTDQQLDNVAILYDVVVAQNNLPIELYLDQNTNTGEATFEVVFSEDGTGPAQVIVAIMAITNDSGSINMEEEVSFNVQVVPEFPVTLAIVMALSIMTIVVMARLSGKQLLKLN